jgi:hypothetical protein
LGRWGITSYFAEGEICRFIAVDVDVVVVVILLLLLLLLYLS